MHIAYLTPEFPHAEVKHSGGLGTSIRNLVQALASQENIEVTVIVYGQEKDAILQENGFKLHLIKNIVFSFGGFYQYRKHIEAYVKKCIRSEKIDVLEAPDWTGITAFMNFKIPLIIRFHGSDTYFCHLEKRKQKWKNRFFETKAIRAAQGYIAPTTFAGKESCTLFKVPVSKMEVIHYGLEIDRFHNTDPDVFTPFTILNIGTLIRKKGVLELAHIFNDVITLEPRAKLICIGADSSDIQTGNNSTWQLMQEILSPDALKNTVYKGKVPYSEVQQSIKDAHVCVFPSFAETLGMVTIESMALQKLVINTNIGWAQDLITHEHDGFMFHPNATSDYVNTILQVFEDEDLRKRVSTNARDTVKRKFDINEIAIQNIEYYKRILAI